MVVYASRVPRRVEIDQILREDQSRPKKQRHTAKRIGERLRAEYGFTGGDTILSQTWVGRDRVAHGVSCEGPGPVGADVACAIDHGGTIRHAATVLADLAEAYARHVSPFSQPPRP